MNMIIGGSRKKKSGGTGDQRRKNDKASILARKRERWKVQKEVHETAQKFQGHGQVLGNGGKHQMHDRNGEHNTMQNTKRPFLLPGRLESASPPQNVPSHQRKYQHQNYSDNVSDNKYTRNIGMDEDVLTKLTERIAIRLRSELRNEVEENAKYDEGTKRDISNKMESFLQNELQQHTCPVCFEPMLPPNKPPMLLFPCGHTFCAECIEKQKRIAKHSCPFCRAKIEKVAVNHSLKQLMETFLKKKESIESGDQTVKNAFGSNNESTKGQYTANVKKGIENHNKATEYMQKCRALKIRGKILKNELEDTKVNLARLDKQTSSSSLVMKTLRKEEAKAMERLEAAKQALELVRNHIDDQNEKIDNIEKERADCQQKVRLIETTIATIDRDADKAYILLQNFSPGTQVIV